MPRTPMIRFMFWLALCTAPLLTTGALHAQTPPGGASPPTASGAPLLAPADWRLEGGSQWQGAQLLVAGSPDDDIVHTASRPVALPAGASWRASLTLAVANPAAEQAAVGLTLLGPDGSVVAVMLRPREREVAVLRGHGRKWLSPLLRWTAAPGLAGDATAPHTLVVESQGSRLSVALDGQEVGRSTLYDMEPVRIGIRAVQGQAVLQALALQATGVDERLARLSGARTLPGAAVLMQEGFTNPLSAAGAARAVTGLFGKLLGKGDAASANSPGDAWGEPWAHERGRFERDTGRKRLVLEGLRDESAVWAAPASGDPLDYAGTAVTARVRVQGSGEDHRAGVMLQAGPAPGGKPGDARSQISVMWGEDTLWMHEYDAAKEKWQLLRHLPWPAQGAAEMTLRLVASADKAWVFVDGRLVMHHGNVEPLRIEGAGLRAEGRTRLEASSFVISEI